MSETLKLCPKCLKPVPTGAPEGLCPQCVMASAAETRSAPPATQRREPPTLESIRAAFPSLEIVELIGAGGMGAVFKARQPKLERWVALKVLPQELAEAPGFAERFAREARLLARLNHPNIVTVYDFGQSGGFYYLLMEYVDGVNLRQAMEAGRFSPPAALSLVPQICDALQFAHQEGILHRDIKPENLLLDTKGRIKIADFGIAKLIGEAVQDVTLTGSGLAVGTPHYMAPEQLERPREVDQRADIYSLGVVFYEMLTGELPIGRFAPPSEKSAADPRVDPIVLRALEKERERRYRSAGEVKTSLERITQEVGEPGSGKPVEAKPLAAGDDFLLCNPALPRMARAIIVYALVVSPLYWLFGLDMADEPPPQQFLPALIHTLAYGTLTAGDFAAVLLLFIGALKLRGLNRAGADLLRVTLWFHLCLLALGVAALLVETVLLPEVVETPVPLAESLYSTIGVGMIAFEIAALIWLRRNRSVLEELCIPAPAPAPDASRSASSKPPPATDAVSATPARPRAAAARGVTASAILTAISLPPGFIMILGLWFTAALPASYDKVAIDNLLQMATGVGVTVLPASLGFLLGLWGLQQIRASGGCLRGRSRALIGALGWPALILAGFTAFTLANLAGGFLSGGRGFVAKIVLCAAGALLAGTSLVYLTWRWAGAVPRGHRPAGSWVVIGVAALVLLGPTALVALVCGSLPPLSALSHRLPAPALSSVGEAAQTTTNAPAEVQPLPPND